MRPWQMQPCWLSVTQRSLRQALALLQKDLLARTSTRSTFIPFMQTEQPLRSTHSTGADSADSVRPRLTLEPLSHATGIPLKLQFSTNEPEALAHALFTEPHGDHVLIAWRHKKIPALLKSLGADPAQLLLDGVWPDAVYDWVILLHYDAAGHLETQKLIHEPDPLP